jgi:hypothetical protein
MNLPTSSQILNISQLTLPNYKVVYNHLKISWPIFANKNQFFWSV